MIDHIALIAELREDARVSLQYSSASMSLEDFVEWRAAAALEQVEAERNKALGELGGLLQSGHKAEGQVIRLTSALAGAREALDAAWILTSDKRIPPWIREALLAALSHPTTESAKAEEEA